MTPTPAQRRWRLQLALLVGCMAILASIIWWTTRNPDQPAKAAKTPSLVWTLDHLRPVGDSFPDAPEELVAVLGDPRGRHDRAVRSVAFSPDGKRLASGGEDGVVRLWNAETLGELEALPSRRLVVSSVTFSGDGKLLAAAASHQVDRKMMVGLWDVTKPRAQLVAELPGYSSGHGPCLAFTKAGDRLAVCAGKGRVEWWDVTARPPQKLTELVHDDNPLPDGGCQAVAYTPDGKTLITVGDGGTDAKGGVRQAIRLWDLTKQPPQPRAAVPSEPARALALALDAAGKTLAVRFRRPEGVEWVEFRRLEGDQATVLGTADLSKFKDAFLSQALAPDGGILALAGNKVHLFDVARREFRELPVSLPNRAFAVAYSPDGKRLAIGDGDGQVRVLLLTEAPPRQLVVADRLTPATRVTLRPDGRFLAVSHEKESKVRLWDLQPATPQPAVPITGVDPRAVAFEPDNRTLVIGDVTLGLRLWNLDPKGPREEMQLALGGEEKSTRLELAPSGQRALRLFKSTTKGFKETLVLWEVSDLTLRQKARLELSQQVTRMAVNDALVAAVLAQDTGDFEVCLWDPNKEGMPKRSVIPMPDPVTALALKADGQGLACTNVEGQTVLWDVSGSQPVEKVRLESKIHGLNTLAFAPDEKTLAGAFGEQVVLWDTTTGRRLRTWNFATGVNYLAFAPDGRHLVTANGNGTVYILRLTKLLPGNGG